MRSRRCDTGLRSLISCLKRPACGGGVDVGPSRSAFCVSRSVSVTLAANHHSKASFHPRRPQWQMQKQAARKRTFEKLPKPDIYKSYRHCRALSLWYRASRQRQRADFACPRPRRATSPMLKKKKYRRGARCPGRVHFQGCGRYSAKLLKPV